ncbi:DUF4352 domain-containing protein [Micropruina sp.]|uniref:DUF4352 domain-containing protein n=1 Tax=Micropruina sp. TaxID=2737536 RepID=UPI0039E57CB4
MSDQLSEPDRPKWIRWLVLGGCALAVVAGGALLVRPANHGSSASTVTPGPATAPGETTPVPTQYIPTPTATGTPSVEPTSAAAATVTAGIDEPAHPAKGVTAEVTAIKAVTGEAQGPGEIAGPALRVTVQVRNRSDGPVDLANTVVNLYYGKKNAPAAALSGPDPVPFSGRLAPGKKAKGSYIFNVPKNQRGQIRVEFRYSTEAAVSIFEGSV